MSDSIAADLEALLSGESGTEVHFSVKHVLQFFRYSHLPTPLQSVSKQCATLACAMAHTQPGNPELTVGLRKLLEAKDCFVRAGLAK